MHEFLGSLAFGYANINEQIVNLRRLRLAFELHQMRCDVAHHAADRAFAGMDHNALGLGDRRIHAAHLADVEVTVVINVVHRHRDFVRMAGEHQAR